MECEHCGEPVLRAMFDDATVDRVVDVMHEQVCGCNQGVEDIGECITYDMWLETASAVLAAAVQEER